MLFFTILVLVCLSYLLLIIFFYSGWTKLSRYEPSSSVKSEVGVTVIVPCKNEADSIQTLLSVLSQQSYQNFDLIVVDDHSTDSTANLVQLAMKSFPQLRYVKSSGVGKKAAIREGVMHFENELVVTIDADCLPTFHWLETIVGYYLRKRSDILIGPVAISQNNLLTVNLQSLELCSLVAVGAGAAGTGYPIMCNGANLAFRREAWIAAQNDIKYDVASGDDMFFLHSAKKDGKSITFLNSESAIVTTVPQTNLRSFLKQRTRWASKTKHYSDWHTLFVSLVVAAMALLPFGLLALSFLNWQYLTILGTVFIFKYFIDTVFLYRAQSLFHFEFVWFYSFVLSIIYPFYIAIVLVLSITRPKLSWK